MRAIDEDYKYLLLNLIPQHKLGAERRRRLGKAIRGGGVTEIRRAGVAALEDLCERGYFERTRVDVAGSDVVVTYVRGGGHTHLRVQVPRDEWHAMKTPGSPGPGIVEPPTPNEGVASDAAFAIIPDIIRALYINGRAESTFERLESIVGLLPEWLSAVSGRLVLSEERLGQEANSGMWVAAVPDKTMMARPVYERCRHSGESEYLGAEAARAEGIAESPHPGSDAAGAEVAVIPLYPSGEFWGILELWFAQSNGRLMRRRTEIAARMIEQVIENAVRLESLTSVDKLTGVYNRNYYEGQVQIEIERATRSGAKLSMLIVDIDDFKRLNDTLGHRKGDEALAMVADLIKKNLRKIDLPFRYGGEEFVVLLPGTSETEAFHTAERLRTVVATIQRFTDESGRRMPVRVSIGAAVFPDHAGSEEELFARADAALYRAKRKGKDRVEFHREP
jgi:diguanylate cyclase (GGDEF)-like protein